MIEFAYFGGFTHTQIAEMLEMPIGTVKGRMRLGLEKLRHQLAGKRVSAREHERFAGDTGAYLLGALEEAERSAFERHLATCHVCHDEVEQLRVAADALPHSVEQYAAPASLKAALMEQVRAEAPAAEARRPWADRLRPGGLRPRAALALTAIALLVGAAGGAAISGLGDDDARAPRSLAATVDDTRIGAGKATLTVRDDGGPGALTVEALPQPPRGQVYEVWLERGDRIEPGPLFSVDRNGRGVAAIPADLDGVTAVMVTRKRAGGAQQPTEAPVISAEAALDPAAGAARTTRARPCSSRPAA